jgi:hypothetical protein
MCTLPYPWVDSHAMGWFCLIVFVWGVVDDHSDSR